MGKYSNNGVCNYIKNRVNSGIKTDLRFYDLRKSLLVVARKEDNLPIALFIDDRCNNPSPEALTAKEKEYGGMCCCIAKQAKLPLLWIRYNDDRQLTNDSDVYLADASIERAFYKVKLKEIVSILGKHHIDCQLRNKEPQKRENEGLSSAFHLWQRTCLDIGVFADLDLIRINDAERVTEIIELKRSIKTPFDIWKPYTTDYTNFKILNNLCIRLGNIPFRIIFNAQVESLPNGDNIIYYYPVKQRYNSNLYDKLDTLKVFEVKYANNQIITPYIGNISIEQLVSGDYSSIINTTN